MALVFFTPHRPWLFEKDMGFFETVEQMGLGVEKVLERRMEGPMFVEDRGVCMRYLGVEGGGWTSGEGGR